MEKSRQHWPSRWIFILAAVGSAAGLGNLWRFPYLAYEHGGGTFVLVLLLANLIVGIPLLSLEVGLGQKMQTAAPGAFGAIKDKFKYVGWFAVMVSVMVLTYYMSVMGWGVNYFASAFNLGWGEDTSAHFFGNVLQLSDGAGVMGGISWPVLTGMIVAYILTYFSVWKGVRSVSKVVKWTATIPFVILAILLLRAVTLEGAASGLELFFIPDWSALSDPKLWIAAFSQVFFSLSLAAGVMVAYGSYNKKKQDITGSVFWIVAGNFLVSLMSGVVVFGTLGYMALQQGVPVTDVVAGGPSLTFVTFPLAISLLPALNSLIAVIFFLMVLTLGIDSAFSLLESFASPIVERYKGVSTKKVMLIITSIIFVFSIPFATKAGLYYLDILDHFVVNYAFVTVGILEALVVGWFWKGNDLLDFINENSKFKMGTGWNIAIKFVIPIFLTVLLVTNLITEFKAPYEGYPTWALIYVGALPVILMPFIGAGIDKLTSKN